MLLSLLCNLSYADASLTSDSTPEEYQILRPTEDMGRECSFCPGEKVV